MPGAFDYGAKNAQQRVAVIGKESSTVRNMISTIVGPKIYQFYTAAGVYRTALSVSGSGAINFCAIQVNGATADTLKLRITIDGRTVFNGSVATTTNGQGIVAVGSVQVDATNNVANYSIQRIPFEKSLLIEATNTSGQSISVSADYEVNA